MDENDTGFIKGFVGKTGKRYGVLVKELQLLFNKYERDGVVAFECEANICWC